jgi:hypothetical protein
MAVAPDAAYAATPVAGGAAPAGGYGSAAENRYGGRARKAGTGFPGDGFTSRRPGPAGPPRSARAGCGKGGRARTFMSGTRACPSRVGRSAPGRVILIVRIPGRFTDTE